MPADIEQLKRRHPIESVVAAHGLRLERQGRRLVARCPFHEDGAPSFSVYPETQSFHCFGCGASGDVIDFVRRARGLGFREAVEQLAGAGSAETVIPPRPAERPRRLSLDDRLTLSAACELYHETALRTPGILRYLETRGIPAWVARQYRVGYSDGRLLVPYLKRRRLSLKRAGELGLLFRSGDEAMAGRVVIPDLRGAHCGWMVGRALDGRSQPKYRGLALPRPLLGHVRTRGNARVFLTEGPFDWLTLVSWGLPACALLGTQPGPGTLEQLARARRVVLVLDSDAPGVEAASRLAAELGERASVLRLPDGVKDVNELGAQPGGRATFFELLDALTGRGREASRAF